MGSRMCGMCIWAMMEYLVENIGFDGMTGRITHQIP